MKGRGKWLPFLVLIFGSFFIFHLAFSASTDIVINEIGAYATSTHEWIEIWNRGSESVDLVGWKFWEAGSSHGLNALTADSNVDPGEYAAIAQDGDQFKIDYPNFVGAIFDSSWSGLNESGEEIGLKDSEGNFVENFSYPPAANFSLERKNPFLAVYDGSNWQENSSGNTVGEINSNFFVETNTSTNNSSSTVLESDFDNWNNLKVNEFVSDPEDGNEWVEIFNIGSSSIDLSGGWLCDNRATTSTCKKTEGIIVGQGWLVIDLQTNSYLNNDGDSVILKNINGEMVDNVIYEGDLLAEKGESIARMTDGVGGWTITTVITKGEANKIESPMVVGNNGGSGGSATINEDEEKVESDSVVTAKKTTTKTTTSTVKNINNVKLSWEIKSSYSASPKQVVLFDAGNTMDPRGGEILFQWDFGDGVMARGELVSHAFVTSGIYFVKVFATSTAGTVGSEEVKILVAPGMSLQNFPVIISEVNIGVSTSSGRDFIKLFNNSSTTYDLSGWSLQSNGKKYVLPIGTKIGPELSLTFYSALTHLTIGKKQTEIIFAAPNQERVFVYRINTPAAVLEKITTSRDIINQPAVNNIATVRQGSAGQSVNVVGIVAVLPGVFGSQYFYIVDETGGIQIYQYKKDFPNLKVGDQIIVSGELSEASGIKRIKLKNKNYLEILAIDQNLPIGEYGIDELDEEMSGNVVKIVGDITEIKSNLMYIDDGMEEAIVYFKKGTSINKKLFQEGAKVEVIGILEKTKTGLQIWPRGQGDVKVVGVSAELQLKQADFTAENNSQAEKYLTATAGGVTTLLLGFLVRARGAMVVNFIKKWRQK